MFSLARAKDPTRSQVIRDLDSDMSRTFTLHDDDASSADDLPQNEIEKRLQAQREMQMVSKASYSSFHHPFLVVSCSFLGFVSITVRLINPQLDLGTGRREYVTTNDKPLPRELRVSKQQLLRARKVEEEGTDAAKWAQENRPALTAWNSRSQVPLCYSELTST
jgi:hypothetical protein